jgi:hypothetical protein
MHRRSKKTFRLRMIKISCTGKKYLLRYLVTLFVSLILQVRISYNDADNLTKHTVNYHI